jgi:tRNA(fMet)-specific endonuclease VapC
MILLDTDIVVAHFKGMPQVSERILSSLAEIAVPAIVLAELDFGAKASARSVENLERLYAFVQVVEVIPFEANCAREYGSLKAELRRIGRPTGPVDALIAATALAHRAVLVTHNTTHYESIPGLRLEDWLA